MKPRKKKPTVPTLLRPTGVSGTTPANVAQGGHGGQYSTPSGGTKPGSTAPLPSSGSSNAQPSLTTGTSSTSGGSSSTGGGNSPHSIPTSSSPLSPVTIAALGLTQTEAGLVPYVLDAAAQNKISPAMLMGLIESQSNFKPKARLGAERGLGMFGPESSHTYDVKHGDDPAAIKSQVEGLAQMLSDADVNKDPIGALNMWSRGDHSDFAEKVMELSRKFRPLDEALKPLATHDGMTQSVETARAARAAVAQGVATAGVVASRTGAGYESDRARAVAEGVPLREGNSRLSKAEQRAVFETGGWVGAAGDVATRASASPVARAAAQAASMIAAKGIVHPVLGKVAPPGAAERRQAALEGPRPRKVALALEKAVRKSAPKALEQYADLGPAAPELAAAALEWGPKYGVDPSFLMAIAEIESGFGSAAGSGTPGAGAVSSAGAQGYMQFMPESRDIVLKETGHDAFSKDPKEAMAAAAAYFSVFAPDAQSNYDRAFSYNHADWYANDVISRAEKYKELDGTKVTSKDVPQNLIQRAKHVLGKPAAKAILAGGQVIRDPKAGEGSGPVDVSSARQEIRAGAITKLKPNEEKFFSYDPNTDRAWFDPILKQQLIALSKASGEPIQLNSGFRTLAEQKAAYADYQAGGNLAATPGSSNHEFGLAADLQLTDTQRSLLPKFGLGLPVAGEDWHVEVVDPNLKAQQTAVNLGTAGGSATVTGENPNIAAKGPSALAVEPAPTTMTGSTLGGVGTTLTGAAASGGWTQMLFDKNGQKPPTPMESTTRLEIPNLASAVMPEGFGGNFDQSGDLMAEEQSLIDQLQAAGKPQRRLTIR